MRRFLLSIAALFLLCAPASNAGAVMIYDGSGDCLAGCTGTATWHLYVVDSYVDGTLLTLGDFVDFDYMDNNFAITLGSFTATGLSGSLPATTASSLVTLTGNVNGSPALFELLATQVSGAWSMSQLPIGYSAGGDNATWGQYTVVGATEPRTLLLSVMGLGLLAGGLLVGRRHRRRVQIEAP